jgi:hypothetical protein
MATVNSTTRLSLVSLDEVRASVKRLQTEGERLVGRVRDDARRLAERAPRPELPAVLVDASKRAEAVVRREADRVLDVVKARTEPLARELRARREQILATAEQRARTLAERAVKALDLVKMLDLAEADRVGELSREVTGLSLRIAELERKLASLSKKQKQQEAAA